MPQAQSKLEESLAGSLGPGYAASTPGQEAMKQFSQISGEIARKVEEGEITPEEAEEEVAEEETRIPVTKTTLPIRFSLPRQSLSDLALQRQKRGPRRFAVGRTNIAPME